MSRSRKALVRGVAVLLVNALALLMLFDSGAAAANSLGVKRNDYNRDGVSDIVGVRWDSGCMYQFAGRTNGTVGTPTFVSCGWEHFQNVEAVGDVNGDGNGDLIGVRIANGCLARWKGNGSGGFTYIGDYGCGWQNYRNLEGPGDVNNDGIGDLIAIRRSDGCAASWYGTGTGGFTYAGDHLCGVANSQVMIGLGDLNGDGHGDVAGTGMVTKSMLTWFSNGGGNFIPSGQHLCCYGGYILT